MPRAYLPAVLLLGALASGCKTLSYIPPATTVTGIDFTPYTSQGFMFTPEMYRGDYESVGVINVSMHAEGRLVTNPRTRAQEWEFAALRVDDVVREAHKRAVDMGANAVVNFSVRAAPRLVGTITQPGLEVTGFAIKRTGAFK